MKNNLLKTNLALGIIAIGGISFAQGTTESDTLFYTGSPQSYVIPNCASNIVITTFGAQGAAGSTINPSINSGGLPGLGNRVTGSWNNLSPGQTIYVHVGGAAEGEMGGYNGGGNGIASGGQNPSGGGGGATDIRFPTEAFSDRVQVAGGGGGGGNAAYHWSGAAFTGGNGGNGGGNQTLYGNSLNGSNGTDVVGDSGFTYPGAMGGTESAPGQPSPGCSSFLGQTGGSNNGANGGNGGLGNTLSLNDFRSNGGGGGGGYVGGNGGGGGSAGTTDCGGNNIGAAGGGSAGTNYFNGPPKNFENGVRAGHGMVVIQYSIVPQIASLSASSVPCVSQPLTLDFAPVGGSFTILQGVSSDVSSNGVFTPSQLGTYEIVYSVIDNCTNQLVSDTLTLEISCDLATLNEEIMHNITLFPNPIENVLNIQAAHQLGQIDIIDIRGMKVYTTQTSMNAIEINLDKLQAGVYFVYTQQGIRKFTIK